MKLHVPLYPRVRKVAAFVAVPLVTAALVLGSAATVNAAVPTAKSNTALTSVKTVVPTPGITVTGSTTTSVTVHVESGQSSTAFKEVKFTGPYTPLCSQDSNGNADKNGVPTCDTTNGPAAGGSWNSFDYTLSISSCQQVSIQYDWKDGTNSQDFHLDNVCPAANTPPTPTSNSEVAIYLYHKLNTSQPAAWENSGTQTLIAHKDGTDFYTTYPGSLPSYVCGDGWAIQQDAETSSGPGPFAWPLNVTYPTDNIGWPPIYKAIHQELSSLIKVPSCQPACPASAAPTKITDLSTMYFEDGTQGTHELVNDAIHITAKGTDASGSNLGTPSSQTKSAGYVTSFDYQLAQVAAGTTSLDYTNNGGADAGLNLTLYANGAWVGNLTLEPLFSKYWTSHVIAGMPAGPNPSYQKAYGTLQDYINAYYNRGVYNLEIKAGGYSLGSGAVGDGLVNEITVGNCPFTFGLPPVTVPAANLDHVGECYANTGFSSENVYVKLDNSGSNVPLRFTGNGIDQVVPAGQVVTAEATPMWDQGGSFDITASYGSSFSKVFHIVVQSFPDCGAVIKPSASIAYGDCVYSGTGGVGTADFRDVTITLDNSGSNRDVLFTFDYFPSYNQVVPAGAIVHVSMQQIWPNGGGYTVEANGKSFDLPITACPTKVATVNPTATASVCTSGTVTPGTYVIPSTTGVAYYKNGSTTPIAAGTYTATPGETVAITAKPADSTYSLVDDTWSWSQTFTVVSICDVTRLAMTGAPIIGGLSLAASLLLGGLLFSTIRFVQWYRRRHNGGMQLG